MRNRNSKNKKTQNQKKENPKTQNQKSNEKWVRFTKSPGKYNLGYFVGDEAPFPAAQADLMASDGYCEIIDKPAK